MALRKILTCKEKINENGKICYGKYFSIEQKDGGRLLARCIKCSKDHPLN